MEVHGNFHVPDALPPVPIGQESEWAPEPVWTLWNREKYSLLQEIEPRFVDRPVHRIGTVLTELSLYRVTCNCFNASAVLWVCNRTAKRTIPRNVVEFFDTTWQAMALNDTAASGLHVLPLPWHGKPKYLDKSSPRATVSTKNPM
jgi:hypothetical protein